MVVIDDCPDCDLDWMLGRAKRGLGPLGCRVDVGSDILLMHSKHLVLSLRLVAHSRGSSLLVPSPSLA
jgi:hypothetical protein